MVKIKKFKNSLNFNPLSASKETFSLPSMTVPDQTLSLKTLLERYTRGQSVATFKPVYLGDEEEFAQFDSMDRLEKIDHLNNLKQQIDSYRSALRSGQFRGGADEERSLRSDESATISEQSVAVKASSKEISPDLS